MAVFDIRYRLFTGRLRFTPSFRSGFTDITSLPFIFSIRIGIEFPYRRTSLLSPAYSLQLLNH